jgi:hypothetical protein
MLRCQDKMPYKHHSQEYKDDAIMYWLGNEETDKKERLNQKECAEMIGELLGQSVSVRTISGWVNNRHYKDGKKGVKRGAYNLGKSKKLIKEEYEELVVFVDDVMLDEYNLKVENQKLRETIANMKKN